MKYFKCLVVIILVTALFSSCKKETGELIDMGYKYFPANTGHWVIYNVDSISYNDFTGNVDIFHFQIKELVESVFTDNSGRTSQRIERYIRSADTVAWTIRDVWYQTLTPSCAERVEENIRLIKLIFPVAAYHEWDGNTFNTLGEQTYKYQDVHTPKTLNNIYLDSTVTVLQKSLYTLISEDFQQEVYAAHIGMVYKKCVALEKQPTGAVIGGIDYSYTLQSYGN